MFVIVTGSMLALDSKFAGGRCLSHVGTEGYAPWPGGVERRANAECLAMCRRRGLDPLNQRPEARGVGAAVRYQRRGEFTDGRETSSGLLCQAPFDHREQSPRQRRRQRRRCLGQHLRDEFGEAGAAERPATSS